MSALRKVLVVDDDPVVTKSFHRVLSREGYVVVTASDGAEALDKLEGGEYDVVYTDIRMPGMDGLELAERVAARRTWTPVVIITGYGTQASETRARAAGVTAFLHKPLSPEMIESSAKEALNAAPAGATEAAAPVAAEASPATAAAPAAPSLWKFVAMMAAAPLIGLAYIVMLPLAGLAALAGMAAKVFVQAGGHRRAATFAKNVGLFFAAPLIGLAYVLLMPFVGLGTMAWIAFRRARKGSLAD